MAKLIPFKGGRKYQGGWWQAALSALGSVAGGMLGSRGQSEANATNLRIAREYRDWSERMSNTEIQRRMEDMRQAGVNPMLSIMGMGSAGTPGAAPPRVENERQQAGEGVSRAGHSAAQVAQLALVESQIEVQKAQARKTNAEATQVEADSQYSAQNAQSRSEKLFSEAKKLAYEVGTAEMEQALRTQDAKALMPLIIQYQQIKNEAARLKIPEAKALAKFFEEVPQAKWIEIVRRTLWR